MPVPETIDVGGKTYPVEEILNPWIQRKNEAERERDQFLPQVRVNRKFAAGKQHLDINPRDGRVIDVRTRGNVRMATSDRLTQYLLTVVGRMAGTDYRPNFLVSQDNELSEMIAQQINDAYGWGWNNEWAGDAKVLQLFRLLTVDGTAAIRCKYDRRFGDVVGDFPYKEGKPVFGKEARDYVAEVAKEGGRVAFSTVREGKIIWEMLSIENMLWPAGYENPMDFPWEIVVRAVKVKDVISRYGDRAEGLGPEPIESSSALTAGLGYYDDKKSQIDDCVFVYTGYRRPDSQFKEGQTVVFTNTHLLDVRDRLPLSDKPKGPRSGIHYFRWQVVPGRFPGRAFIEGGIETQKIINKRITQMDTIIDRGMPRVFAEEHSTSRPRTGEPMEIVDVRPGSPLPQVVQGVSPGAWMLQDIKLQQESLDASMGIKSITLGQPPQGVSAYSAMALLSENDALKLDPIAQEVRLEMVELAWDTMENMRNWPKSKFIQIAGPDGRVRAFEFNSNIIPPRFLVTPPRGGSLPRSQAAELQKINDVFNAAIQIGLVQKSPEVWHAWYVRSLNAGSLQELPSSLQDINAHKAALENVIMIQTGKSLPVSEGDDHAKHAEIHLAEQLQLEAIAHEDSVAAAAADAIQQHREEHLQKAEASASGANLAGIGSPGPGAPPKIQNPTMQTPEQIGQSQGPGVGMASTPPLPGLGT